MGAEVSYQIVHLHDLGTAKTVCPCQKHFWYGLRAPVRNVLDDVCTRCVAMMVVNRERGIIMLSE